MSESTQKAETPSFVPSPEFLARKKRLDDAMSLKKPDRVPIAPLVVHYYLTRVRGISNRDAMYNPEKTMEAWKEATIQHGWDAAITFGSLLPLRPMEILGMRQFKWPGGGLPDDRPFQWVEGEYMMQDEYDEVLADPNGFAVKKLWPRISTTLAPISGMSQMPPPPLLFLSNAYTLPRLLGEIVSSPPMAGLLRKALELAETHAKYEQLVTPYTMEMMNLGLSLHFGAVAFATFDWISDALGGMRGTMLDMYQVPDKLLAAVEMFTPLTIGGCIMMAEQTHNKGVFIPMHVGLVGSCPTNSLPGFTGPVSRPCCLD